MRKLFAAFILLAVFQSAGAQNVSNLRIKKISIKADSVLLDSVSIVPHSAFLMDAENKVMDTAVYEIDFVQGILKWRKSSDAYKQLQTDSLAIHYRTFPFLFSQQYKHKDLSRISKRTESDYNPFAYNPSQEEATFFKYEGLTKSGSISRGISFGNNQDVYVNSTLNLQLSGRLNDKVNILAAITDENVPLQPEGNTQQLQDFDKVFIQLYNDRTKLIAGDFELKRPDSYFMSFFKKGQGAYFTTNFDVGKQSVDLKPKAINRIGGSIAVSKGKFARNVIQSLEGNQGPYRLRGANNESYIIVLAGTEKVFIDGSLMQRGLQLDYTIDYNTAEVTFTAKRLITKDSRIVVEFEYSEKSYARSMLYFNEEWMAQKYSIKFNAYSEQDSKNQPLLQELDSAKKTVLANVGDSITQAFYPTADSIEFTADEVLYAKIDTTTSSGTFPGIFLYSTSADSAHYRVSFSNVGPGNGDYVQDINSANGRVFKWVSPDSVTGAHLGSYEPVGLLIAPKAQQLFTLASDVQISKYNRAGVEVALSNNNVNLFSTKNKSDDKGYASKLYYQNIAPLTSDTLAGWRVTSTLNYEYVQRDFKPVERYRNVEFERDWNLGTSTIYNDENIGSAGVALSKLAVGNISYLVRSYTKGSAYNGLQHAVGMNSMLAKFILNANASILNTKGAANRTEYLKHNADLARSLWKITLGVKENTEQNEIRATGSDTLSRISFLFREYSGYISTRDTLKNKLLLNYKKRYDDSPVSNSFRRATEADEITFSSDFSSKTNHQLRLNSSYRKLKVLDTLLTSQKETKTLLNRLEHLIILWKGTINAATTYEIGTGQERKLEYYFIKVADGQGSYIYRGDINNNGTQDLDEFDISLQPSEAPNYIKVYTPTNDYISTRSNQFSEVFSLNPAAAYSSFEKGQPLFTRFANTFSVRLDKKTINEDVFRALNPFDKKINDTTLVSNNSSYRNTLYFNRTSVKYGADATWQRNESKSLLTNGLESREQTVYEVNTRWNISRLFLLNVNYQQGDKINFSQFFSSRNYHILSEAVEPKLTLQPSTSFRTAFSYRYSEKKNTEGELGEQAFSSKFGLEIKYSAATIGSVTGKVNYIDILFNADENSSIAYDMLEGLKNGKNTTWNVSAQRNLGASMQLSLNYDGLKSGSNKAVHTGGVQFRAYF
jgi:hypothetical protein